MTAKKIIYIIYAVIFSTLAIIFRAAALPIELAYATLDALANTYSKTFDEILENFKGQE